MLIGFHHLSRRYDEETDRIVFSKKCSISGNIYEVSITPLQADEMVSPERRSIQDILPDFSVDEREFLLSGLTPDEFDSLYSEEE